MRKILLLLLLLFAARTPQRKIHPGRHNRKNPVDLLGFAESDYKKPTPDEVFWKNAASALTVGLDLEEIQAITSMSEEAQGELVKRVEALSDAEPIPTVEDLTLTEFESAAARIILEGPRRRPVAEWLDAEKRFDTPIGRTLTAELLEKDRTHVPPIVLRHIPITDAQREKFHRSVDKHEATLPKGRPTPKRKRKRRGH